MRYKYNLFILKKKELIRKLTLEFYGYALTDDQYIKLCNPNNRNNYFDKLLCLMTNKYFKINNINNVNNLHRWNLSNREKTKHEKNYPW